MTRAEYIISLRAWDKYIFEISSHECYNLQYAFGTMGKALTEFQSIYSVFAEHYKRRGGKKPYIPSKDDYVAIIRELELRTKVKIDAIEENNWEKEIRFD